jgi:hypothetical protein
MGERLDVPFYILKALVNHKIQRDITGRYIILDVERLRPFAEKISSAFVELLGANINDIAERRRVERLETDSSRQLQFQMKWTGRPTQ